MDVIKIILVFICTMSLSISCNRNIKVEQINDAEYIMVYPSFKEKLVIEGNSDTAIIIKDIFVSISRGPISKNKSFRDATDLNKFVFYYNDKTMTAWINRLNREEIVFGIEETKYVLDSLMEIQTIQKIEKTLGITLFEE